MRSGPQCAMLQDATEGSLLPHMHIKPLLFPVDNFICIGECSIPCCLSVLGCMDPAAPKPLAQHFVHCWFVDMFVNANGLYIPSWGLAGMSQLADPPESGSVWAFCLPWYCEGHAIHASTGNNGRTCLAEPLGTEAAHNYQIASDCILVNTTLTSMCDGLMHDV